MKENQAMINQLLLLIAAAGWRIKIQLLVQIFLINHFRLPCITDNEKNRLFLHYIIIDDGRFNEFILMAFSIKMYRREHKLRMNKLIIDSSWLDRSISCYLWRGKSSAHTYIIVVLVIFVFSYAHYIPHNIYYTWS